MSEQVISFFTFTVAPLGLISLCYIVFHFFRTPVIIYEAQQNEIDKHNWNKVKWLSTSFQIPGLGGHGVKIVNGKHLSLDDLSVWLISIREGLSTNIFPKPLRLGFIHEKTNNILFKSTELDPEQELTFVVVGNDDPDPIRRILRNPFSHKAWTEGDKPFLDFSQDTQIIIELRAKTEMLYVLPAKQITCDIPNTDIPLLSMSIM